jgi:formate dehydrogenase iron-sulfur subunit
VMLYQITQRAWWSGGRTAFKFFGTAAVLGTATSLAIGLLTLSALDGTSGQLFATLAAVLPLLAFVKVVGELSVLLHLGDRRHGDLKRSARLLVSHLAYAQRLRLTCAVLGAVVAPLACRAALEANSQGWAACWALAGLLLLIGGELCERFTFFAALSSPRMPGGFR